MRMAYYRRPDNLLHLLITHHTSSLPDLEFYFGVGQLLIFSPALKLAALKEQIEGDFQKPPALKNPIQKNPAKPALNF